MNPELDRLLRLQAGVVSRRQALEHGQEPHDLRRLVRRREWAPVHAGVYVDHTGALSWLQRAWAAVLFAWPAALSHDSAIRAADGPGRRDRNDHGPIHVAVAVTRDLVAPKGVVLHRMAHLEDRTLWNTSPPRLRVEEAVLDCAAGEASEMRTIALLADAVQSRRTTAPRLLGALDRRDRVAGRDFMRGILQDIAEGACSVLEHGYLDRVERPHGLPRPRRQNRGGVHLASDVHLSAADRPVVYRDIDYEDFGLVVELDGRLFHDSAAARDLDLERDLEARGSDGRDTVRLGWGQVFERACSTARAIGALLQQRGWAGSPVRCPRCPPLSDGDGWPGWAGGPVDGQVVDTSCQVDAWGC